MTTTGAFSNIQNTAIVARMAGFTGKALTTIVAIAGCESGYNPTSLNTKPPDYSVGLFQINYFGSLLQPRTQAYGSPQQLLADPLAQARAAYAVSNGGASFSPWSTYNSGCYVSKLPEAAAAVASTEGASNPTWQTGSDATLASSSAIGSTAGSVPSDDSDCLFSLPSLGPIGGCLLHRSNLRAFAGAGILTGGVIVTLVGVVLLVAHTGVAKQVLQFAGPVGKLASKVPSTDDRLARRAERNPTPSRMPAPKRYNSAGELVNARGQRINERGEAFF